MDSSASTQPSDLPDEGQGGAARPDEATSHQPQQIPRHRDVDGGQATASDPIIPEPQPMPDPEPTPVPDPGRPMPVPDPGEPEPLPSPSPLPDPSASGSSAATPPDEDASRDEDSGDAALSPGDMLVVLPGPLPQVHVTHQPDGREERRSSAVPA